MNAKELAALLDGGKYTHEVTPEIAQQAKDAGLVILYGASDDLMEFEGAIHDEIGCYDGGTAYLTSAGLLSNDCENTDCPYFQDLLEKAATIEALWGKESSYSWTFATTIPHETFEITEDGDPYCRGIVFALSDVKP